MARSSVLWMSNGASGGRDRPDMRKRKETENTRRGRVREEMEAVERASGWQRVGMRRQRQPRIAPCPAGFGCPHL
eukprot:760747-Hanusia_phi.AAC.2